MGRNVLVIVVPLGEFFGLTTEQRLWWQSKSQNSQSHCFQSFPTLLLSNNSNTPRIAVIFMRAMIKCDGHISWDHATNSTSKISSEANSCLQCLKNFSVYSSFSV
ncbi:hypothetical protein SETIT_6G022300v2 [Setaria italica]|uniref:Uncharacterized protein n=1 Tax=Setaria italica TaxID=4555 RepID=A0A368RHB4_SETIT|nr:hypothetical protein SETIT_6G022300v2 [Setaria italica]